MKHSFDTGMNDYRKNKQRDEKTKADDSSRLAKLKQRIGGKR